MDLKLSIKKETEYISCIQDCNLVKALCPYHELQKQKVNYFSLMEVSQALPNGGQYLAIGKEKKKYSKIYVKNYFISIAFPVDPI